MSKKELLNETQIRRFMKLANLEPLAKNVVSEGGGQIPQDPRHAESVRPEDEKRLAEMSTDEVPTSDMSEEAEMELDVEEPSSDAAAGNFDAKAVVKATVDALVAGLKQAGVDVGDISVEDEGGEDAGAEMDMGSEEGEEAEEGEEEGEEAEEKDEEAMDEASSSPLSEDSLVEAVLTRVTARLMEEAKKAKAKKAKKGVPAKMAAKAAEKKKNDKETLEEATSAEGGGPLLKQGKNKFDVYKGHADMKMAKGDKGGSGGHSLETVSAKAEHTVTHGGKNLATLGGNKKKV